MRLIRLIKGWPGKPSHPPLTDATIGAYTVGVAMLVFGAFGVLEDGMAHGSLLAIGGGLAVAVPGRYRAAPRTVFLRSSHGRETA